MAGLIVEEIGRFAENGHIYRDKRAVHWCPQCATALAEAEVEYEEHTSPAITVRFPIDPEAFRDRVPGLTGPERAVVRGASQRRPGLSSATPRARETVPPRRAS